MTPTGPDPHSGDGNQPLAVDSRHQNESGANECGANESGANECVAHERRAA